MSHRKPFKHRLKVIQRYIPSWSAASIPKNSSKILIRTAREWFGACTGTLYRDASLTLSRKTPTLLPAGSALGF